MSVQQFSDVTIGPPTHPTNLKSLVWLSSIAFYIISSFIWDVSGFYTLTFSCLLADPHLSTLKNSLINSADHCPKLIDSKIYFTCIIYSGYQDCEFQFPKDEFVLILLPVQEQHVHLFKYMTHLKLS